TAQGYTRGNSLGARVGPAKLFLREHLKRRETGELTDGQGNSVIQHESNLFQARQSGLLGGKRDVLWEGVSLSANGGEPQSYYRLAFEKRDGATRDGEANSYERFRDAMGAVANEAVFDDAGKLIEGEVQRRDGRKGSRFNPIKHLKNAFDGK